jgi:heptosyltransferase-2
LSILSHCNSSIGNEGGAINMGKVQGILTFFIFSPWINKSSCNVSENSKKYISIHLQDLRYCYLEHCTDTA